MKNVLISATLSATLGLSAFSSLAQDVDLRMSWWGGNGRHQVTLKALEEFHKQNPDINVKAEYTGWDGHLSRLTTQIAGGTEPDVMQTNWNWLPIFSKNGDGFYDLNTLKDEIDLSQYDYVVDCVDTVTAKLELIKRCYALHIPIISCMGAANKLDATAFRVADINKTKMDPLAHPSSFIVHGSLKLQEFYLINLGIFGLMRRYGRENS